MEGPSKCRCVFLYGFSSTITDICIVEENKASSKPVNMDMTKPVNKEVGEDDLFARLPDELLHLILSKMDDLKFLCQCSLVSKRFALTIYSIQNVSLTLPSNETYFTEPTESTESTDNLFEQMLDSTSEEITELIQSSPIQKLKFSIFLQNFRELKSIYLEFMYPSIIRGSSLYKWKAKCRSGRPMLESFVSMFANTVRGDTEGEFDEEEEEEETLRKFSIAHMRGMDSFLPLKCWKEWLLILCVLVKCHRSLESVTITDFGRHAKLALRGEELVEWRKNLLSGGFSINFVPRFCGMGWVCKLHLPLSGYVMKGAYIAYMGFMPELDSSKAYGDSVTWEYEEEEKLLGEALSEVAKNHVD